MYQKSERLDRRITANIDAELVHEFIGGDDGGVQEVVLEGQGHVHLSHRHTDGQTLEVLDSVPLPVGVVEHVAGVEVSVLHGQVGAELGHLGGTSHHVHLTTAQRLHVGGVLGV